MDLPFRCCLSGGWLWDLSSQSKTKPQGSECLPVLWCCFLQTQDGSPASATDSWTALSSLAHPQLSKALHTSAGHSPDLGWPCSLSSSWPWVVPAPPFDYSQPNPFLPVSHTPPPQARLIIRSSQSISHITMLVSHRLVLPC